MKSRIINVNFKPIEFDRFGNQAGLNSFALSAKKWFHRLYPCKYVNIDIQFVA